MVAAIRIPNSIAFREMWADGVKVDDIGAVFGVSGTAVSRAAARYDLPERKAGSRVKKTTTRPSLVSPPSQLTVLAARRDAGAVWTTEFWTLERDALVLQTKGKYAAIAQLGRDWGRSSIVITRRWHVLRVLR